MSEKPFGSLTLRAGSHPLQLRIATVGQAENSTAIRGLTKPKRAPMTGWQLSGF
jgi:hypothetical protein